MRCSGLRWQANGEYGVGLEQVSILESLLPFPFITAIDNLSRQSICGNPNRYAICRNMNRSTCACAEQLTAMIDIRYSAGSSWIARQRGY